MPEITTIIADFTDGSTDEELIERHRGNVLTAMQQAGAVVDETTEFQIEIERDAELDFGGGELTRVPIAVYFTAEADRREV